MTQDFGTSRWLLSNENTPVARARGRGAMSPPGRFCCKSLFVLAIKISFGGTGDFHVNMWGTSSSEEKLAGDPGNVIEATSIGGRRSDFFTAGKLAPGNFGLLQQYRHEPAVPECPLHGRFWE
jgi:hypothetical protein